MVRILPLLLLGISGVAVAASTEPLTRQFPGVHWGAQAAVDVDLDGDGKDDRFAMGVTPDGGEVVVVRLADGRTSKLEFEPGTFSCSVLKAGRGCPPPRPLRVTVIDASMRRDAADMFEVPPSIFVDNGRGHLIVVEVGETDPFWFYWDTSRNALSWLRL